ncbi:MAG: type II secretion system protein [Parvularcula sp.]|jgi:type II secretion system protein I|nr:type II secretion system protein [Parvularcula sp.]
MNKRGMTLIEVLVALMILSGVVGSVLVLISQHTRQAAGLEERMLARIEAENALALYLAQRELGRPAELTGDIDRAGQTFRFALKRQAAPIQGWELVTSEVRIEDREQVLASFTTLSPVAQGVSVSPSEPAQ